MQDDGIFSNPGLNRETMIGLKVSKDEHDNECYIAQKEEMTEANSAVTWLAVAQGGMLGEHSQMNQGINVRKLDVWKSSLKTPELEI